ncbi:MAG: hypothetical protein IJW78_03435 [Clostridia bacterium]|nr:hypothetical protein [Clostridia bacterium]
MIFTDKTNQPEAMREVAYTVTAEGLIPATVQHGGVQGEHRATRLIFQLDAELEQRFTEMLSIGQIFCRIDVCDGSGVVHRSLPLEFTGSFAEYSTIYYDLEQAVTRAGGILKLCMVLSLLKGQSKTWEKIKSAYALLQLEPSPTYAEESWSDMNGLYEQTKIYAEQAIASAESANASLIGAQTAKVDAQASAASMEDSVAQCLSSKEVCIQKADFIVDAAQSAAESAAQAAEERAVVAEVKDEFSAVIITSGETEAAATAEDNHEYRYTNPLTALTLTLPAGLTAADRFSAMLCFQTPADSDIAFSYSTADIDFSNDDCEDGVFLPIRNKGYDVALYWNGRKYQGVVRGVAL